MATKRNVARNEVKVMKTNFKLPTWGAIQAIKWEEKFLFLQDKRFRISVGLSLIFFSLFLFFSILSFLFTGKADQSIIESTYTVASGKEIENWLGLWGAELSHFFIYKLFGIASILCAPFFFLLGYRIQTGKETIPLLRMFTFCIFVMTWISLAMGYFVEVSSSHNALFFLCGNIGIRLAEVFNSFAGVATIFLLVLSLAIFLVYFFELTSWSKFKAIIKNGIVPFENIFKKVVPNAAKQPDKPSSSNANGATSSASSVSPHPSSSERSMPIVPFDLEEKKKEEEISPDSYRAKEKNLSNFNLIIEDSTNTHESEVALLHVPPQESLVEKPEESTEETALENKEVSDLATPSLEEVSLDEVPDDVAEYVDDPKLVYDPTLDLSSYRPPDLELLNEIKEERKVQVTPEELEANVTKIVETLRHFNVNIKPIKATIGPTVTLYEIVPDSGTKISRIRALEDDIALNLAALGIRMIAPIPGKGTIGIEVPNKNRQIVSLRSILATEKFANTSKELPLALGRTISNEVFITDLTKMPHLLIAGATGQGKSVGLNVIITSLLYKKHPAELKFVMIDPKKVELSLFNTIKHHFLATLPDDEEPIITDYKQAINALNSLCIEMNNRYNLLKEAAARNIKEYNNKFISRKLNPRKGHRYLPYIVLIIDELADLMIISGKEVETPIVRLAQLSRAIGIHIIIATQRPSVDVVTGLIKANFPARLSFKVSSRIDSRTILDTGGAEQLIGMGDMLLSNGSEIIRLQCAYVDTEEVERICEFIGAQQGYPTPYLLPEYFTQENGESKQASDMLDRDELFEQAARLVVSSQQGSTSLLQRKFGIGYNRAGRIMDQLELAGIVGPPDGSKPRQLLVQDEYMLEEIFRKLHH